MYSAGCERCSSFATLVKFSVWPLLPRMLQLFYGPSKDISDMWRILGRPVEELTSKNIYTHCISLDEKADGYIQDIFGKNGYTVIDQVEKLPEKLPQLFMSLSK